MSCCAAIAIMGFARSATASCVQDCELVAELACPLAEHIGCRIFDERDARDNCQAVVDIACTFNDVLDGCEAFCGVSPDSRRTGSSTTPPPQRTAPTSAQVAYASVIEHFEAYNRGDLTSWARLLAPTLDCWGPDSWVSSDDIVADQRTQSWSQFNAGGRTLAVRSARSIYSSSTLVRIEVEVDSMRPTRSTYYRTYGVVVELIGGRWRITSSVNVQSQSRRPSLPSGWWTYCFDAD